MMCFLIYHFFTDRRRSPTGN